MSTARDAEKGALARAAGRGQREESDGGRAAALRLDWNRKGLSAWAERIVYAAAEGLLADEDEKGELVPGPKDACSRAVYAVSDSLGRSSADLRRGYAVLVFVIELLPLFVIGAPSRMSRLSIDRRVAFLEALESSRIGLLAMLFIAFKVPLCVPAFEDGNELLLTGYDRPSTVSRRKLEVLTSPKETAPSHLPTSSAAPIVNGASREDSPANTLYNAAP